MRIVSISYDGSLLTTRQLLLERAGHQVTSARSFSAAVVLCEDATFDLLVLGHSIPILEKSELVSTFRSHSHAPILSLTRCGEVPVSSDYYADADQPRELLATVAEILAKPPSRR